VLKVSYFGATVSFRSANSKQMALLDYILVTERDFIELALNGLRAGDTFLDVGCNYGIFSIIASKLVGEAGRVIAVDPHPGTLEVLHQNIVLNRCQNIQVRNVAFSDRSGVLALAFGDNGAGPQTGSDEASAVHEVAAMAGDEALREAPIPAVVKIDVEGHELAVLNGLKRTLSSDSCRRLCLEIHPTLLPRGIEKKRVLAFVESCGFRVVSEMVRGQALHVVATK